MYDIISACLLVSPNLNLKQIMIILSTCVWWKIWNFSLIIWVVWDTFFTTYYLALFIANITTHMHVPIFYRFTFVRWQNMVPRTNNFIINIQFHIIISVFTSRFLYINDIANPPSLLALPYCWTKVSISLDTHN